MIGRCGIGKKRSFKKKNANEIFVYFVKSRLCTIKIPIYRVDIGVLERAKKTTKREQSKNDEEYKYK